MELLKHLGGQWFVQIAGKVYSHPMIAMRGHVIFLLLMALPLSSLAGAAAPCIQDNGQSGTQETVIDAETGHGRVHHGSHGQAQDVQEIVSDHDAAQGADTAPIDCPCCDYCLTMCVMSGCSVAAVNADSRGLSLAADDPSVPRPDFFRVGPTPHPLFRPPIQIA